MNILEKILEEKELAAIKDLIEENEECLNECKGACGSIKNGVCNCDDGILVQAIRKIQDYLSVVTDTNVGSKSNWIPCSERLPEDGEEMVLIQVSGKPTENIQFKYAFEFAYYEKEEGWILEYYPEWENPEVVAWMPLPESYKGGEAAG